MKNERLLTTILLTTATLSLTACGNTATASVAETEKNQVVVENTTTIESETAVIESVIPETTETDVAVESEVVSSESEKTTDPNFNGAGHTETLEETKQTYITYESIEPTTMYVISNTTGERYSTYHDPNVSEGELYESGLVDANQELLIDGKATYNGVDYYRLAFQPEMMLNHQIIIPADLVTSEPQQQETPADTEKPVDTQKPVEQQPEVQQPTDPLPPAEPEVPEWTPDTGVSKEDWDAFFGGGNTTGQHTWNPDYGDSYMDADGNVHNSGLTPEELEKLGQLKWE